jgi:hypothetical protein
MALGKESMAGHWCMQCKASRLQFKHDCEMWTMEELVRCGEDAEKNKGDPVLGVKKKPWWPFIPLSNYLTPLLHCLIGIGNQLIEKLRAIINEHIAEYSPGKEATRASIPVLKNIIADTAKERDEWDESDEGGKKQKMLMRAVDAYKKRREIVLASNNEQEETTHRANLLTLKDLSDTCNQLVNKLKQARRTLADQQLKLKAMQAAKGKQEGSVDTKLFKVLKEVGVELSSYHGGSLNGKDTKKVMNNATFIFEELAIIMKEGKRPDCILTDADIDALCLHFQGVFVLWDGAFSLARTVGPMEDDIKTYRLYVAAAEHGNDALRCTTTPKAHLMLKHIAWQMENIPGGLGDKMEDFVERMHQTGIRLRDRFRRVKNPVARAQAREKANSRSSHPDVIAHIDSTTESKKRSFSAVKIEDTITTKRKKQRDCGRFEAMKYFDKDAKTKLTWLELILDVRKVDSCDVARANGIIMSSSPEDFL